MIALNGSLDKDTTLQVGFVQFYPVQKNWENLVASLRSSAAEGSGGGGRGYHSLPIAFFPVAQPVS